MAEDSDRNENGVSKRITELGKKATQLLAFSGRPLSVREDSPPLVQIATEVCYMGNRRDPRITARLQVRIAGMDAHARALLQIVTTRNISRHGALLEGLQGTLKPGEIISITYENNKARFRVSWVGASSRLITVPAWHL